MNWNDIRAAFALGENERNRIVDFRQDRFDSIKEVRLRHPSRLILHIIPLGSVGGVPVVNIDRLHNDHHNLRTLYYGDGIGRCTLEGYELRTQDNTGSTLAYTRMYREGMIEAVLCELVRDGLVSPQQIEKVLIEQLPSYTYELQKHGVAPPAIICLSFTGVKNAKMSVPPHLSLFGGHAIEHDDLLLSPILLNSFEDKLDLALKPAFDMFWNAAGWPGSLNYNEESNWVDVSRRRL